MVAMLFQDEKSEWRWHIKALNGRIVADSAEGYRRRRDCLKMLEKMIAANIVVRGRYD